jgi:5-methylcytosine-specific restriction enzyme subunit McrC
VSVQWNQFLFDGNNQNYQFLVNICRFIYEEKLMTTENGKYKMKSLSDDQMERLFEKFVLEYYKKHHPETKPLGGKQIRWKTKTTSNILPIMKTDIILTLGKRTLIIDTKYYSKSMNDYYETKKIYSDHANQIGLYVTNYDIGHTGTVDGMLLYAKTQEDVVPDDKDTLIDGNVLYYKTLDLNKEFHEISKQLDGFIKLSNHGSTDYLGYCGKGSCD